MHGGSVQREFHHQLLIGRFLCAEDVWYEAAFRLCTRAEFLREPLFGFLEGLALALLLLFQGYIGPGHLFLRDIGSVVGRVQVRQDNRNTGSVGNYVVKVHIEVVSVGGFVDFQAEEAVFVQVHRFRKGASHLVYAGYFLYFCFPAFRGRLLHAWHPVFFHNMGKNVRMSGHKGLQGTFEFLEVYALRELEQHRLLIITGSLVQSLAGQEHAQLRLRERRNHSLSVCVLQI